MKKIKIFALTTYYLALSTFLIAAGENPVDFLELTIPAENMACGKTYTAYSIGANSLWLNPAGLGASRDIEYSISGMKGIMDIKFINGGILLPLKDFGNAGLGLSFLSSGEENLESYIGEESSSKKLNFRNVIFGAGYGREFYNFPVGISLKFIQSEIGLDKKFLVLGDLGAETRFSFLKLYKSEEKNLGLGIALRNIGILNYKDSSFGEIKLGMDYKVVKTKAVDWNISFDISSYAFKGIDFGLGSKLNIFDTASFYCGYNPSQVNKFTFGLGIKLYIRKWNLKMDYGLNPSVEGLPISHWFELSLKS